MEKEPNSHEWHSLIEEMPRRQRFLAEAWFRAWATAYLPSDNWRPPLRLLSIYDGGGTLLGVMPTATQVFMGVPFCSLGGYYWPFRSIPMNRDRGTTEAAADSLAQFAAADPDIPAMRLGPVNADDPAVEGVVTALRTSGWHVISKQLGQLFGLNLPRDYRGFEAELGSDICKKVAYYARRLAKLGDMRVEAFHSLPPDRWNDIVADVALIEQNSWVAKEGGDTKFSQGREKEFWHALCQDKTVTDTLFVWLLYVGDVPVAYSFNIHCGGIKYILANGYDESFEKHSPGMIVAQHMIRHAIESGMTQINWGLGDSGYKQRWGAVPVGVLKDYLAFRPGIKGAAAARLACMLRGYEH